MRKRTMRVDSLDAPECTQLGDVLTRQSAIGRRLVVVHDRMADHKPDLHKPGARLTAEARSYGTRGSTKNPDMPMSTTDDPRPPEHR